MDRPEWRETLLLLAGTLLVKQGRVKVDGLFRAVLDRVDKMPSLAEQARCAGLLGGGDAGGSQGTRPSEPERLRDWTSGGVRLLFYYPVKIKPLLQVKSATIMGGTGRFRTIPAGPGSFLIPRQNQAKLGAYLSWADLRRAPGTSFVTL